MRPLWMDILLGVIIVCIFLFGLVWLGKLLDRLATPYRVVMVAVDASNLDEIEALMAEVRKYDPDIPRIYYSQNGDVVLWHIHVNKHAYSVFYNQLKVTLRNAEVVSC